MNTKPKPPAQRGAYPIREGFAWLGIGHQRGYQLISAGLLKSYLVGRRRMCTHQALVECLEKLQQGKAARCGSKKDEALTTVGAAQGFS